MTVGGGEAADQMVRMMLSSGEVAIRLSGSALKNLLALTMALAKNNQTISGKVSMGKMLKETRDLRLFPMSPEQYRQFARLAKKQKILFSAIHDRDGKGKVIDVVMPVTELDRANLIFERILYQDTAKQAPKRDGRAAPSGRDAPKRDRERPEVMPPKKDFPSGRDSPDTRTRPSMPETSDRMRTSDRPSILDQLKGFRAQLDDRHGSVPTRDKSKVRPKQR